MGHPGPGRPVLLDGALATELQRHGVALTAPWMTTAPLLGEDGRRLLGRIHAGYVAAGAQVITANTFRANLRALVRGGMDLERAGRLVRAAVGIARQAADHGVARVAASIAPVEDCYRPELVPAVADLRAEHGWMARMVAEAGADIGLVETMNSVREARVAVESVVRAGLVPWVSFVCSAGARLLSGEELDGAVRAVEEAGASVVMVNCTAVEWVDECLLALRAAARVPIGVYPNIEDRTGIPDWTHVAGHVPVGCGVAEFAQATAGWLDKYRLDVVGGCCGSTPDHIAALRTVIDRPPEPADG
jgi:S-methylmethionine-dependent homocysteine/selenocysteine methylase